MSAKYYWPIGMIVDVDLDVAEYRAVIERYSSNGIWVRLDSGRPIRVASWRITGA